MTRRTRSSLHTAYRSSRPPTLGRYGPPTPPAPAEIDGPLTTQEWDTVAALLDDAPPRRHPSQRRPVFGNGGRPSIVVNSSVRPRGVKRTVFPQSPTRRRTVPRTQNLVMPYWIDPARAVNPPRNLVDRNL